MIDNNKHDPEWDDAQAIWAAGKVDIPAERDAECNHFLSDLKLPGAQETIFRRADHQPSARGRGIARPRTDRW